MDSNTKKIVIPVVVALVLIAVYSIFGTLMYVNSIVIYDKFPEQFFYNPLNDEEEFELSVHNNSPLTLPFLNPFYSFSGSIEAENNAFGYFIGYGQLKRNFTDYSLDLGRINAGESKQIGIFLHPDEGNLTLKIDIYFDFLVKIKATSKTYSIEYLGNYEYNITRIK